MQVTNLGDCGFRVIREGSCIFASDVSPLLCCPTHNNTEFELVPVCGRCVPVLT